MADETKTQVPKPTRQRGPMGRMGGMRRGEKAKDFKGTMRQLLGYIGQHKIAVFAAVAFAVCSVIFNIVGPKVLGQVTTKLFEGLVAKVNGTGDVDFDWIAKTLGFLLCLYLASSVCSLIQGWLMTGVTQKICYRMRKEIAAKIAVVPMSYFNGHSKGDVLSRITNDVDTLGQSLNQSVTQLITSMTQIIGVLVMMLSISLPLTGVTVLTLPAAAIILTVMIHFSQPYFREQQQVLGTVNGIIEEDFAGQNVIQVFDRAEASIEEFDRQNDRLFVSGWRSQFLSGLMMPLMSLVGNMGYVGVVVVGAQLALTGNATPGDIQSFIQYVRNFTQPVQQLGNVSNTMQSMAAATERVFEFLAAPEEEQKADAQIPEKRPGHVEFTTSSLATRPTRPSSTTLAARRSPVRPSPSSAPPAPARPRSLSCCSAFTTWTAVRCASKASTCATGTARRCAASLPWCCRTPGCLTAPSARTSATDAPMRPTPRSRPLHAPHAATTLSIRSPAATTL